ncbi:MAG: hypothetical protein GX089_05340 [Fibrobacter sp.]|nr:hypothetical protein [Fibrobacter sp.]
MLTKILIVKILIRDKLGNFAGASSDIVLHNSNPDIIGVEKGTEGEIIINKTGTGESKLTISHPLYSSSKFSYTLVVITDDISVSAGHLTSLPVIYRKPNAEYNVYDIAGRKYSTKNPAGRNISGLFIRDIDAGKRYKTEL